MATSAAEISTFVDTVLASTGATKTNIVGHSEGTTVPAYYMKFLGGGAKVKNFVGFGANYNGTTLGGLGSLGSDLGISYILNGGGCGACSDFLPGSAFLNKLDAGSVAVAGPTYTNILTKYDEVVTPYTSGVINAPNVTNIVLQDRCTNDYSGHLGLAIDPNVQSYVLNALDPANAQPVNCRAFSSFGA